MDFFAVLAVTSGVASLAGAVAPAKHRRERVIHGMYCCAVAAVSCVAVWYWQANTRTKNVERSATALIENADFGYTHSGFILASLAFMEKNKDLYPDAYARAIKLSDKCDCLHKTTTETIDLQNSIQGLLRGIGTLESDRSR